MPTSGISLAKDVEDQIDAFFVPSSFKDENGKPLYGKRRWIICTIVDKGGKDEIVIKSTATMEKTFEDLKVTLAEEEAAYVIFEYEMPPKKDDSVAGQSSYPVFITWVNDAKCKVKLKMKMSSSESAIKPRCKSHCKAVMTCHDIGEISHEDILAEISKKVIK